VADGASQTITRPDNHHIEVAAAGIFHHLVEARAARLRAADPVFISFDDLELALPRQFLEVVELRYRVLIEGRDPQVQCGALHLYLLQGGGLLLHEACHVVEEAEPRRAGLRLLDFEEGLDLEELDGGLDTTKLLVDLAAVKTGAKGAAAADVFHGASPGSARVNRES
jgi:hypothetical protein